MALSPRRRFVLWVSGVSLFIAVAIQAIGPARTNPTVDRTRTIDAALHVPPNVTAILDRACRDCHSDGTRWPWYSGIAPVSWLVVEHVNHGRSHLNFSDWTRYSSEEGARLLKGMCDLTRKGDMPMGSYLWLHGDAKLSDADVAALCAWTTDALAVASTRQE